MPAEFIRTYFESLLESIPYGGLWIPLLFEIYEQNPYRVVQFYGVAVKLDLN